MRQTRLVQLGILDGVPTWQPDQYARFAAERKLPFDDLVALCDPVGGGLVYDLGCGPGSLTVELAERLDAGRAVGIDSSDEMLDRAQPLARRSNGGPAIEFRSGDLADFVPDVPADLIFANASLHWVDDHRSVLHRWRGGLAGGGQLAVQVPTNHDHIVYRLAAEIAAEHRHLFRSGCPPSLVAATVEQPETYAAILHELGCPSPFVSLRVYCHELASADAAVEWIRGSTLLRFQDAAIDQPSFDEYLREYRAALRATVGDHRPYLFTFKRILMWARF